MLRFLTAVLVFSACASAPGDDGSIPDGGDGGVNRPDADPTASEGITINFVANPSFPHTAGGVTIDDAEIELVAISVSGDAAPIGTAATSLAMKKLEWEAGVSPSPIVFSEAPSGIYSSFDALIQPPGGETHSYRIRGTAMVGASTHDFEIEDTLSRELQLALDLELEPQESEQITVVFDVASVVEGIDWSVVPLDGNELVLDESDPQIIGVRTRLVDAFYIL